MQQGASSRISQVLLKSQKYINSLIIREHCNEAHNHHGNYSSGFDGGGQTYLRYPSLARRRGFWGGCCCRPKTVGRVGDPSLPSAPFVISDIVRTTATTCACHVHSRSLNRLTLTGAYSFSLSDAGTKVDSSDSCNGEHCGCSSDSSSSAWANT